MTDKKGRILSIGFQHNKTVFYGHKIQFYYHLKTETFFNKTQTGRAIMIPTTF